MTKDLFKNRYRIFQIVFLLVGILFTVRLFFVQVLDTRYATEARSNAIKEIEVYPTRGYIYDRHGKLIVYNEAIYDIMVVPREAKNFDTLKLCELMGISSGEFMRRWNEMKKSRYYSSYKPNVFIKQLSPRDYVRFREVMYLLPGFYGQVRAVRQYPYKGGAVILGDIGEVNDNEIRDFGGYYKPGEYIGKNGIERMYEKELAGRKGKKYVFVDVHNREVGRFNDGMFDTLARSGYNLTTTLDIELQQYGEQLMQNKKGSIVAIEPATGEILVCVSSPGYDPNLLVGSVRGENFKKLLADSLKPLFNRPIMATYPPGSTFKPLVGLIALSEGVQSEDYTVPCNGMYYFAGLALKCSHRHPSATNIEYALTQSCNPYFWQTFRNSIESRQFPTVQESYGTWAEYCRSFGLGKKTGVDMPGEKRGNIPSLDYYNKMYGKKGWHSSTIISLGIGQGEILVTPLQLCNLYTTIANRGFYYTPHIVKKITDPETGKEVSHPIEKHQSKVDFKTFRRTIDGLENVVIAGTARASKIDSIAVCGKTGTVQNPHGKDHSVFCGFAPKENPKIAIAVVVENSGFGATYAAPIASLIMEKYLKDSIPARRLEIEKKMMQMDLIHPAQHPDTHATTNNPDRQH